MQRAPIVLIAISILLWFAAPARARQQDEDGGTGAQQQSSSASQPKQDSSARRERQEEMSSSKDTRIDLGPPADDAKKHPQSSAAVTDTDDDDNGSDVSEMHPWDPHKAAKDVEVGDFYYKRKNYRAAIDRYKEALVYKPNDAEATYRLAECQDKTGDSAEAITHYEDYLKILPHGAYADDAHKALNRLNPAKGQTSN